MNRICSILLLCALGSSAAAQETPDTVALPELVVSATRLPLERSTIAASVTVLHGDELMRRGVRTVDEALRTVSGATLVQSGSFGALASLFLRGGESDYVQVLLDGVQVNSPGEHFDFSNLTLENIERIEIVRGPGSVLYGSDAVSGVVQLFTRAGGARNRMSIAASGGLGNRVGAAAEGSFGSASFHGELRGRADRLSYSAGVSHFRSEGAYAFNNEHRNTGVTGRATLAANARTDLAATLRYSTNTFHYPTDGAGNLVDANTFHMAAAIAAGLDVVHRFGQQLEARMQLGYNRNQDRYDDDPDSAADTLGFYAFYSHERFQRAAADLRFNYALAPRTIVTIGAEYEQQRERGSSVSESEFGPFPGASAEQRSNGAVYAQFVGGSRRINLQAGARAEDNERFGSHATYRGGISARVSHALRLRATAGTGFKEPRFYEQFATGFVKGNPDLEPETSRSMEIGADLTGRNWRLGATWFAQRFRNLIQYVGMPASADASNYLNLGAARARGFELETAYTRGSLTGRVAYTRLATRVTDGGTGDDPLFFENHRLIRRPVHSGSAVLSYATPRATFSATANYVGERDDLDFGGFPAARVQLDPYLRLDLAAAVPVRVRDLHATIEVENALAEAYQESHNFPARGRVVYVGVRYAR